MDGFSNRVFCDVWHSGMTLWPEFWHIGYSFRPSWERWSWSLNPVFPYGDSSTHVFCRVWHAKINPWLGFWTPSYVWNVNLNIIWRISGRSPGRVKPPPRRLGIGPPRGSKNWTPIRVKLTLGGNAWFRAFLGVPNGTKNGPPGRPWGVARWSAQRLIWSLLFAQVPWTTESNW